MAKNQLEWLINLVLGLVSIAGSIAVGGLFTTGATLGYPVLKVITSGAIHNFIGWVIIVGGLLQALRLFGIKL